MPSADNYPAALDAPLGSPSRPSWRGRVHLIALWSAIPLLVVLAVQSNGARARVATIVYGVGLCSMLAVYAHSVGNANLLRESVDGLERTLLE